jgi:hypothetical protein
MAIDVYDTPCDAAVASGVELDPTDFDFNCWVGLGDFAVLAEEWLVDYTELTPATMTWRVLPAAGGRTAGISYVQITNDGDSDINSGGTFTHAVDFGTGGAATVNGVVFANDIGTAAGGRSNSGTRTYGTSPSGDNSAPGVTGDVRSVFLDFVYVAGEGPDPNTIELTGLTSGQWYDLRLYDHSYGYHTGDGSLRTYYLAYDVGSDVSVEYTTPKIDQNNPNGTPPGLSGDVSWATSYVYQADATGKIKVTIEKAADADGSNYHLYGLTNQEVVVGQSGTIISMTATTASDLSGVEYLFTETSGNLGGGPAVWQDSTYYIDTGLTSGTMYSYKVKARDKSAAQNETAESTVESATTD